jgi:hypothetical protein
VKHYRRNVSVLSLNWLISSCRRPAKNNNPLKGVIFLCLLLTVSIFPYSLLAATKQPLKYEDGDLMARLILRTPDQIEAFYLGRGFSKKAIRKITDTCFITAIVKNKNVDVLWLELDNWTFTSKSQPIARITRDYWKKQWREVNMPLNHQSTFGWTLLPDVRDLRRYEGVGGNVAIPRQSGPFDLTMRFKTGPEKNGREKKIIFRDLRCGTNKP